MSLSLSRDFFPQNSIRTERINGPFAFPFFFGDHPEWFFERRQIHVGFTRCGESWFCCHQEIVLRLCSWWEFSCFPCPHNRVNKKNVKSNHQTKKQGNRATSSAGMDMVLRELREVGRSCGLFFVRLVARLSVPSPPCTRERHPRRHESSPMGDGRGSRFVTPDSKCDSWG